VPAALPFQKCLHRTNDSRDESWRFFSFLDLYDEPVKNARQQILLFCLQKRVFWFIMSPIPKQIPVF